MSAGDVGGPVGGAVVDDDRTSARRHAGQEPRQRRGLVEHGDDDVHRPSTVPGRSVALALAVWIGLIAGARWWGIALIERGDLRGLRAAPLYGRWDALVTPRLALPIAVLALVVWRGPAIARRAPIGTVIGAAAITALVWSVALALVDGTAALTAPLESRHEYLPFARGLVDVGAFVDHLTERIAEHPIHVQGHPPGTVVLLALLDSRGLAGTGFVAALCIVGGAVAVAAVLVLTVEVAGETAARRAAPFVAVLPAAIWMATTLDALYAGVGLAGVALFARATGSARRGRGLAAGAGVLLGVGLHLSYGLALLGPAVLLLAWRRRSFGALLAVGAGVLAVTAWFLVAGFAWWEGLAATHERYVAGIASSRPYTYSLVGNLAAVALAVGPATTVGLVARRAGAAIVARAALALVVAANLSGLATGEVERIWLFLAVPLGVAGGALAPTRPWLVTHGIAAIALAALLRTPW